MADANQAADELARALAKVQQELADFGRTTQQTQDEVKDAQMKAKYGVENYTKATSKGAEAVMALASAGMAAGKAMYDGKKGAAAFNDSLDEMSKAATAAGVALALLVPGGILIKGLIAGLTAATTAFIKYEQAANEMADKLSKGYQGLSKAGGAAADGMTGVFKDAKKLGLSMNELDQMVSLVAENSKDFALFAGSVSEGRKKFADLGQAMAPARQGLMNLGMDMKDINEGTAAYLRMQTQTGRAQQMTTAQLARGAQDYLKEMDGLTKLTGQSRSEMQQQRDRMMQQEQSAAKLRALEMSGNKDGADALKVLGNMLGAAGPKMQAAFNASITGNLASKEAQEANLASQGELARVVELVQNKQISAAEGAQRVAKAMGNTADTVGTQLGQLNAYESSGYGNFAEQQKLRLMAEQGFTEQLGKINKDQAAQVAGADKITDQQSQLVLKQMEANAALEKFVFAHIPAAQKHMIALATAAAAAANALNILAGAGDGSKVNATPTQHTQLSSVGANYQATDDERKAMMESLNDPSVSKRDKEWIQQQLKNLPARAAGGPVAAGKSYLVGEKGPELFIPAAAGQIVPNAGSGSDTEERADKMDKFAKTMLKDTESLTKITDTDLKRTKNFSLLQTKLFDKKTTLMEDELELLDEQNEILEQMLTIAEKAGGKEAAVAMKKSFTMARMNMGGGGGYGGGGREGGGASMGGGSGLQMPSSPSMSGMGGGQGLKGPEEHQAVGTGGGQGIKGPPKLASVRSKTGKSAQVNTEYASKFQGLIDYLDSVGYEINSLGGYIDRDVRGKPGVKSVHSHGGAIDINPGANPMGSQLITDMPENISAMAKQLGLGWGGNWASIKDAMHFSVALNEGGDIKLSDGGVAVGPNGGYPATLHGEEAVIPLNNGGGNFVKLFESMADSNSRMAAMMEEMVRAQKSSVDVQNKMLRAQS
jgi:hypothetical protein